jgi:CRP/FNR family cyclic AMP-dependent transcriptional regulator
VLVIGRSAMERLLRTEPALAQRFITYLLSRTVRIEDDLMDQLLSSCEQRLARRLLLLAGYGHRGTRKKIVPRTSQLTLAGIVGSTRPRINYFLQKFKTQGFVDMDGSLTVHRSLLSVVSPFLRGSLRNSSSQLAGDRVMRRMAGRRVVKAAVSDSSRFVKKKD